MQEQCPSWLYPVLHGATTIWERWDAITPEGRVNQEGIAMISFNHYALGAVADWLHRVVGGLSPLAPGGASSASRRNPAVQLSSASSRLETPYGLASSIWVVEDGTVTVEAIVPPNTTAHVRSPRRVRGPAGRLRIAPVDGAVRADGDPGSGYVVGRRDARPRRPARSTGDRWCA